jgi:hypothetical protein
MAENVGGDRENVSCPPCPIVAEGTARILMLNLLTILPIDHRIKKAGGVEKLKARAAQQSGDMDTTA